MFFSMYFSISSEMTQYHFLIGAIILAFTPCICTLNPSLGSIFSLWSFFQQFWIMSALEIKKKPHSESIA